MLILAAILAIFVYGMIAAMLGTILPDLSARFKLTPKQNGAIASMQALGLIIASVGVGPLIDNEGKKAGAVRFAGIAVGDRFHTYTATAQGFAISSGWLGLAISSRVIGTIAGGDPKRLKTALPVIPAASLLIIAVNLSLR